MKSPTPSQLHRFFHRATTEICSHLLPEDALLACARLLEAHMPVKTMYLEVYEHELGAIRSIARATSETGTAMDLLVPMNAAQRADIEGFREQSPDENVFVVNRASEDPVSREMLAALGEPIRTSILGTYPSLDGKALGAVVVTADGDDRFDANHARLFGQLRSPFAVAITNAMRHRELLALKGRLVDDNRYLQRELRAGRGDDIIGADFGLADVVRAARQVAAHDSPVMLLGETGVGKDVIANHIHQLSPRRTGPFIKLNCGAIPESLVDSELFGHEKGAFTGALTQKRGRFERADGGTIFLDEIGELPLAAQTRLLRVLQNGEVERVGGDRVQSVDIRVIGATHRDLASMVSRGEFREDLWFRLNVFPITVPPLRARKGDIPALVQHFLETKSRDLRLGEVPALTPGLVDRLVAYPWPGNVRELQNVLERALILSGGQKILQVGFLGDALEERTPATASEDDENLSLDQVVAKHIRRTLAACGGRVDGKDGAASRLKVNPNTLRSRMRKLGIEFGRRRG